MPQSKKKRSQRAGAAAKTARPLARSGAGAASPESASSLPAGLQRRQAPDLAAGKETLALPSTPQLAKPISAVPVSRKSASNGRASGNLASGSDRERPTGSAPTKPATSPAAGAAAAPAAPTAADRRPSDGGADELPAWVAKALAEVLLLTYWIDPGEQGDPFDATIRFTGRRKGVTGRPQAGDTFSQEDTVTGVLPGSGPVAITAKVSGVTAGEWEVTAEPVTRRGNARFRSWTSAGPQTPGNGPVPWPRRVKIPAEFPATARTARLPRTKLPGVVRFAYSTLVSLGVLVGLGVEYLLLHVGHYVAFGPLMYSLAAVAAGAVGGKAWFIAVRRGKQFDGWCIQGFVAGAAVVIAIAALVGTGMPSAALLSVAAPALLIGMAVGRPGCFWAGCCTGRPVSARWGIWSSDRTLGCRRAPAQLIEALSALIIGVAVLCVVLLAGFERSGPMAVAALAAYTLVRQFVIGLRAEPRRWKYGRRVTAAAAAIALVASIAVFAVR